MSTKRHFVSYEVAKLLSEHGFDELCHHFYDKDGKLHKFSESIHPKGMRNTYCISIGCVSAPNIFDVGTWFKRYNLHFDISSVTLRGRINWKVDVMENVTDTVGWYWFPNDVNTYTKAFNETIKYCFEEIIK